jgi:hypothetical protein
MPKSKVSDPITDQEITYARLILNGKMSDQQAAEAAGLNPTTAAYTKAKPRVQAWMQEHRALMQKQILDQEADDLRRKSEVREKVLARLWEIANLSHEETRGNITSQMKALAMIVAIEGLIPDRRAASAQKTVAPSTPHRIYQAEWLRKRNAHPPSGPAIPENHQEHEPDTVETTTAPEAPNPSPEPAPDPTPLHPVSFAEANSSPYTSFVPGTRNSTIFQRNPFARRR